MITSPQPDASSKSGKLDIVIVNWNSGERLRHCLDALLASPEDVACIGKLIIVDNASTDGSAELHDFVNALPLHIVSNQTNRGFAAACNQGAAMGRAGALLFLNPDVRICPGAVTKSVDFVFAEPRARIGAVGVKLIGDGGLTQRSCARFPTPWRLVAQSLFLDRLAPALVRPHFMLEWDHETTREVDQVMGAFLMMPRSVFEKIGGFDERFFVYFEDVDLCLRLRQAGWSVMHMAEAKAIHEGQGTTRAIRDIRLFYSWRARLLYAAKHFTLGGLILCVVATLFLEPPIRIGATLARGSMKDARAVANAYRLLLRALTHLSFLGDRRR
ncbi:MAG: glycosyltransferase family 2 protein [Acidobacteriaceae bacterium]|nr:glycosyltransferase family 2 protein [Acidobacteriaceae bacterium]